MVDLGLRIALSANALRAYSPILLVAPMRMIGGDHDQKFEVSSQGKQVVAR